MSEVMAILKYEFLHSWGHVCKGEVIIRTLSDAQSLCVRMNNIQGEGTHWVEPSNYTYEEFIESMKS